MHGDESARPPHGGDGEGHGDPPFRIEFAPHAAGLRAHVHGADATPAITHAYWRRIAEQVRQRKATGLLLIDELTGDALTAGDWERLVGQLRDDGFDDVRIAHVKPHGLQQIEYCELSAKEAGLDARVFDNETQADLWLRYGER